MSDAQATPQVSAEQAPSQGSDKPFSNDRDGVMEAARELTKRREQSEKPTVKMGYQDHAPKTRSLKEAAQDVKEVRQHRAATGMVAGGMSEAEAVEAVTSSTLDELEHGEVKQGPTPKEGEELSTLKAARRLAEWRAGQFKSNVFAELVEDPKPETALADNPETWPPQIEPGEPQPDADANPQNQQQMEQEAAAQRLSLLGLLAGGERQWTDINTVDDLHRLRAANPQRFNHFMEYAQSTLNLANAIQQKEMALAAERSAQESASWKKFTAEQDRAFEEATPEFKDPVKKQQLQTATLTVLKDAGIGGDELDALVKGRVKIDIRDARAQRILADAARYRMLKAAPKPQPTRPVPQVVRPGVAPSHSERRNEDVAGLKEKFERTGSPKDAAAYLTAKRQARA